MIFELGLDLILFFVFFILPRFSNTNIGIGVREIPNRGKETNEVKELRILLILRKWLKDQDAKSKEKKLNPN